MVNAGLIKATVVVDFTAKFWKQVLPSITVHDTIALREGADLGWVVRKNSPKLLARSQPLAVAKSAPARRVATSVAQVPAEHQVRQGRDVGRRD